MKQQHSDKSSN